MIASIKSIGLLRTTIPWSSSFSFTTSRHLPCLILAILSAIASGAPVPINAYLLGKIFASFTNFANGGLDSGAFKHDMVKYNTYVAINGAASWLFNSLGFSLWHLFGDLQARSAQDRLFGAFLTKSMAWYDCRTEGISALCARISFFVRQLQTACALPMCLSIQYLATAIGCVVLAFYLSWKITLIIVAGTPIVALIVPITSTKFQRCHSAQLQHLTAASTRFAGALNHIETVKSYNGQAETLKQYRAMLASARLEHGRGALWHALQVAIVRLATLTMFVQGFWFGSVLLDKGQISAGQIIAAFWSAMLAIQAITNIMPHLLILEKARFAGHKLHVIAHSHMGVENVDEKPEEALQIRLAGDIEFRSVSFAYPAGGARLVLDNVDFYFPAGDTTFLVGKSGSGKSTIGHLLSKFYRPDSGIITIDGKDLFDPMLSLVRNKILLVEQQSHLFTGTLAENIALGDSDQNASTAEVRAALAFASMQEAVDLMAAGSLTEIGSHGNTLSGGQKQRIALARAWLRDPSVLILDESTSALDPINRIRIMAAIRRWRAGRTTIIITHDIDHILSEDFVYVLADGKVVQAGFRKTLENAIESAFRDLVAADNHQENHAVQYHSSTSATTAEDFSNRRQDSPEDNIHDFDVDEPSSTINRMSRLLPRLSTCSEGIFRYHIAGQVADESSLSPNAQHKALPDRRWTKTNRFSELSFDDWYSSTTLELCSSSTMKQPSSSEIRDCECLSVLAAKTCNSDEVKNASPQANPSPSLLRLLETFWPCFQESQQKHIILATLACSVYAVSTPMFSYFFSRLLSTVYRTADRQAQARTYSLVVLGIAIVDAIAMYVMQLELARCGEIWANKLRALSCRLLLAQPRWFFDDAENSTSRLLETLDTHGEVMQQLITHFVGNMLVIAVMTTTAIIWSLIICWQLTGVLLACIPVVCAISWATDSAGGRLESQVMSASERTNRIFSETSTSISTVRTLMLESFFRRKHRVANEIAFKHGVRRALVSGSLFGLAESTVTFLTALLFYYGSVLLVKGTYSLEHITQVFTLLLLTLSSVSVILCSLPQVNLSKDAANRMLRLARLSAICHEDYGVSDVRSIGGITFANVRFVYPGQPDSIVLDGLSLDVSQGECLALVGRSGSGKSSIAKLLCKLYHPTATRAMKSGYETVPGTISLFGTAIGELNTRQLRCEVAIVSQIPAILPGTVAENITYGQFDDVRTRRRSHVEAAARAAGAHDFIMSLPSAYNTVIGEGGVGLSGGQAQRIAIARALMRQPQLLILDEVTSALDGESAALIRQTIRLLLHAQRAAKGGRKMTIIVITHSREMMLVADTICMLDKGRVVEQGRFDELMACNGAFSSFFRGQVVDE